MKAIAAVDKTWAIGKGGELLISIPEDMKFFRQTTSGKVVVMGRKTLESFPGKKPLKNRVNIVLTGNKNYCPEGEAIVVHDIDELMQTVSSYNKDDVFVIGGGSVYSLLLPYCDEIYITKVEAAFEADTYFPDLDNDGQWELYEEGASREYEGTAFRFCTYRRKH